MPRIANLVSLILLSVFASSFIAGFSVESVSVFCCICYCDLTPPKIHRVWHYPEMPEYEDKVLVLAYITDAKSGVANATLSYSVSMRERINLIMNKTYDLYIAEIPSQSYNATVTYLVYAYDKAGNKIIHGISVIVDNTPPEVGALEWTPKETVANETVNVSVQASESGSGIKNATLWFRRLGDEWTSKPMTLQGGNWTCTIHGQEENAIITFYAEFYDDAGNVAKTSESYYTVKAAPSAGFPL